MSDTYEPLGELSENTHLRSNIKKNVYNTTIVANDLENASSSGKSASTRSSRRRKSKYAKNGQNDKAAYNYDCHLRKLNAKSLYGVAFYQKRMMRNGQPQYIFATVGGTCCMVYECLQPTGMRLLMSFVDSKKEENYYTCAWTRDIPVLAVAGQNGIIRLLSIRQGKLLDNLIGHGGAINELKVKNELLLSASKDHSVRLWNIRSKVMIAIFSGVNGHRAEILSADFHISGKYIVSCGMDHAINIWSLTETAIRDAIDQSNAYNINSGFSFPTVRQHYPIYSSLDVHNNYVDCVQWFQDFILSKSCENEIICWKPGDLSTPLNMIEVTKSKNKYVLSRFEYKKCDIWYIRFAFHAYQHILALGNQVGEVNIWEFDPSCPYRTIKSVLKHADSNSSVRQVALSCDANVLVYVCDNGSIWRWNKADPTKQTR